MLWTDLTPLERATLCFIRKGDQLLLIHKKRGLGAGKVNAPGGKIESGETELQAAIRETREEIGVTPLHLDKRAELQFQFTDGYSLHCAVFIATDLLGEPVETEEAAPFWVCISEVPYDAMWADDRHWLPLVLAGKCVSGCFTFDGESMLTKDVEIRAAFLND
jgi:8-oxo-dGTP diphosphatase